MHPRCCTRQNYFYPRSPCGERPGHPAPCRSAPSISIHALLAESDASTTTTIICTVSFLSTLSLRRATIRNSPALLGNSQFLSTLSLRRATREPTALRTPHQRFLSTLSLRRATAKVHKTVGHFCAYETNFMEIASSC